MKEESSGKLGIGFSGSPYSAREIAGLAKLAESSGFSSFWIAEDYFLRDSITLLSCAAFATSEIELAAGIINPFTRHPALIAQTSAALNELSNGRFKLAIGTGVRNLIESMGLTKAAHPLSSMEEAVELIRMLLSGKLVEEYSGKSFSLRNARIGQNPYISYPTDNFGRVPIDSFEIYLGAIGPRMLELSARIYDGVLLTAGLTTGKVAGAKSLLTSVHTNARKRSDSFTIAGYLPTCLGKPSKPIKTFVADAVNFQPDSLIDSGIDEKKVGLLTDNFTKKGVEGAIEFVTEDMIKAIVICGSKSEIEDRVDDYRKAGMDLPILLPMDTDAGNLIRNLNSQ